jgi:imidazolonepropionase-like amidohydrolase
MAVHRPVELELKAQVMTPMEVLVSATRVNAELFGLADRIGTVEPGKEADLIAVDGNPLEDLRVFQDPRRLSLVLKAGEVSTRTL